MSEPEAPDYSAEQFWEQLEEHGVKLTDKYSANGAVRFCRKRDGELFTVSVHDRYPYILVDKVLQENGFMDIPIYNSSQI